MRKFIEPDDYTFDHTSMAAVAAGIKVLPSMTDRFKNGERWWGRYSTTQVRQAIRHAHCLTGCLDAPLSDHVGTS